MLIQLLDYLQSEKTYSIQELAALLNKDIESVQAELRYLESQGYIKKVTSPAGCNHNCKGCQGCDPAGSNMTVWEVVKKHTE